MRFLLPYQAQTYPTAWRRSCTRRRLSGTQNRSDGHLCGSHGRRSHTRRCRLPGESADFIATDFETASPSSPSTEEPRTSDRLGAPRLPPGWPSRTDRRCLSIPVAESARIARRWSGQLQDGRGCNRAIASPAFRFCLEIDRSGTAPLIPLQVAATAAKPPATGTCFPPTPGVATTLQQIGHAGLRPNPVHNRRG